MVDFWEVFGRMVANDAFRQQLYDKCPYRPYSVGIEVPAFGNKGLAIPAADYSTARQIIAVVITDGPVSLATLGETLMILSCTHFHTLADTLAQAVQRTVNTAGRSKLFYIGLGCMLLDNQVEYAFSQRLFAAFQFGGLSQAEQDALYTLATTNAVTNAAHTACAEFWSIACADYYEYYPPQDPGFRAFVESSRSSTRALKGSPVQQGPHMHPIVQPYPPADCSN